MVVGRPITCKCILRPAEPGLLFKLGDVLFEQFQQGFLLDAYTEIGIFEFGGDDITVRLHYS